jgi:microcompartment protein CcmK/EutM
MFIGEVIGTVIASRKTDNMQGLPLRIVRKVAVDHAPSETYLVAVDVVGADSGELVLVASGSPARQTHLTDARPCDAVIMAVVDTWQTGHQVHYTKAETV